MAEKRKIASVVVVYNMFCGDSPTCRALEQTAQNDDILVVIYDNSTRPFGNEEYCAQRGWVYLGGTGNVGISRAYNACVEYLLTTNAELMCLFDDDTELDEAYFECLRQTPWEDGDIFVPLIYAGGGLLSPCLLHPGHRVEQFADAEAAMGYQGELLSAINSCMALKLSLFADYRYDEAIFLDGVDHNFLADQKAAGAKIRVIPYRCDHGFSGAEKPPKASALNRFRIYSKDYAYILRNDRKAYRRLVGKRALRLTAQYRSLEFLRCLKQNAPKRCG